MRTLTKISLIGYLSMMLWVGSVDVRIKAQQPDQAGGGPWLVFISASSDDNNVPNTLWRVKPDGSHLTRLAQADQITSFAASVTSHEIAYITTSTIGDGPPYYPVLNLIFLPSGKSRMLTKLTSSN